MNRLKLLMLGLAGLVLFASCSNKRQGDPKVLIFSKTKAFRHASIPAGIDAIQKLGAENHFSVDTTENAAAFNEANLSQYSTVIFLSTTGDVLDAAQEAAFERYIQAGGGYVGIHAATDTEYDWGWYGKLAGGYFLSHPRGTPEADFHIKAKNHPSTEFFQDTVWHRTDEMYNFKKLNPDVNVLLTIDESTYEGGQNGDYHPMAWYHDYDGGRAFYTALGHTDESFSEENYLKHLLGGIKYAIGENLNLNYKKAHSQIPPEANRFSKVPLVTGAFYEPTEMAILPNEDILIAQRRGEILLYEQAKDTLYQVAYLDVYHKTLRTPGVNAEEGLMGLQKDPDYANNHWIYAYYAPTGDAQINRLSRFKFENGVFDLESEQIILEVGSDREICCHTGGSIAFGGDGLLYLSTGDNTTPFNEPGAPYVHNGFGPLNDEPGRSQYDARRSSGNTNDLRGKVLRIRVNEDGSYGIPDGNLFPEGTAGTRPEIYTMGHRNPYRISVDPKNGYLYWGDVGPDASADSLATRGPRGYDEINQARSAGNFGWPLFIADNKAYRAYNYATGEHGDAFDPEHPINNSRNNTGLQELPPAQPAMVYYHYGESSEFPQVASGGRNAMAGPAYYKDMYSGEGSLPDFYDGKVLVYDWIRGWMKSVELFPDGTFNKMVPFASDIKLHNLIDMEVAPSGRIYLLEYGTGWFTKNEDSGLSYIEYNGGNRAPLAHSLEIDKSSGQPPLQINATLNAEDLEGDAVSYLWQLGNGDSLVTQTPSLDYTYSGVGEFLLSAMAIDASGNRSEALQQTMYVGNSRPEVIISTMGGNESFFVPGIPLNYEIQIMDEGQVVTPSTGSYYVSVDYREGLDEASLNRGHQQASALISGKALTQSLDCKSCHKENEPSIGPSYMDVSKKYQEGRRNTNMRYLVEKIAQGGGGVWGEVMMPAHPNISLSERQDIASYILSLADTREQAASLPLTGAVQPDANQTGSNLVITATYTDEGMNGVKALTGTAVLALKGNRISPSEDMDLKGMQAMSFGGMNLALFNAAEGSLKLANYDLSGVKMILLIAAWQTPPAAGCDFELHLDSPDGKLVGQGSMNTPQSGQGTGIPVILSESFTGKQTLYLTYKRQSSGSEEPGMLAVTGIEFQ
ncbi:MAG: hypothetical protein RLZZ241_1986 [Bacteroidota bacterium]|jgi:glucose/arabinose dehydrogenase/type 1 glutamine amidotransferase/cytochrome c551/c552